MKRALILAEEGLGQVWPNPAVGALIVKNTHILSTGVTQKGGRPHAETEAIKNAKGEAEGATLYVTLEPCAHIGQTPPCAEAIINAGIARVVVAVRDPDPRTAGKGIALLKAAGIEVVEGVCEEEAAWLNRGFFSRIKRGRPWVMLKLATSMNGVMAPADGSRWITNEAAREHGQRLRATQDAILTGTGTFLHDTPQLNVRIAGLEHRSPARFVLGNTPIQAEGFVQFPRAASIKETLEMLGSQGITRLMVEAGPRLTRAFLEEDMADEIAHFQAPCTLEGNGVDINVINAFALHSTLTFGDNTLFIRTCSLV